MQDSALRWSQCISARSSVSLLVGSGKRSAAGGGAAGFAEALTAGAGEASLAVPLDALALAAALAPAAAALGLALLAADALGTALIAGLTLATVALGARGAMAATGRSGSPPDGAGTVIGAPPELPIAANAPAPPPTAIASQVAKRAPISSTLGVRAGHRRSACVRERPRTSPSDRGYSPGKAADL